MCRRSCERTLYERPSLCHTRVMPDGRVAAIPVERLIAHWSQIPPGVMTRDGTTFDSPPQIPDLIGIRDHRYPDHTATHLHLSIADLMRYAALARGAGAGSSWADFPRAFATNPQKLADDAFRAVHVTALTAKQVAVAHSEYRRNDRASFLRWKTGLSPESNEVSLSNSLKESNGYKERPHAALMYSSSRDIYTQTSFE